jgi:hypothetical protein
VFSLTNLEVVAREKEEVAKKEVLLSFARLVLTALRAGCRSDLDVRAANDPGEAALDAVHPGPQEEQLRRSHQYFSATKAARLAPLQSLSPLHSPHMHTTQPRL